MTMVLVILPAEMTRPWRRKKEGSRSKNGDKSVSTQHTQVLHFTLKETHTFRPTSMSVPPWLFCLHR